VKFWYAGAANVLAASMLPFLLIQGKYTRRVTPRLPEATGARQGRIAAGTASSPTIKLLAIGESPVAGVGVGHQTEAITYRFAHALAKQRACNVAWQALGKNGLTVAQASRELMPLLPPLPAARQDVVLIAFGVNDTSSFRSLRAYQRDLRAMVMQVLLQCQPSLILLSSVPPVGSLPALPQPLRLVLGLKARSLDLVTLALVASLQKEGHSMVHYVALGVDLTDPRLVASDGYHPSSHGCEMWAQHLAREVVKRLPL
jgi:lysophospholipase L1-like esterase